MNAKITALALPLLFALPTHAATNYLLTVTNGTLMPLSPGVVYVTNDQLPLGLVGQLHHLVLCNFAKPAIRLCARKNLL